VIGASLVLLLWVPEPAPAAPPPGPSSRSVEDLRHKVSPNGRHFVDQGGRPFFHLGDTCWHLFRRLNREEVEECPKDPAGKCFTVIQAYVLRGLGKKHPDGNSSVLGATPLLDRDPTRPNEELFKNVGYVINRANELGPGPRLVVATPRHRTPWCSWATTSTGGRAAGACWSR
jgi:hypothetical protein